MTRAASGGAANAGSGRALVLTANGRVLRLEIDRPSSDVITPDAFESLVFDTQQTEVASVAIDLTGARFAVASSGGIVIGALDGRRLLARSHPIGQSVQPTLSVDGQVLAAGLASEGLYDLSQPDPSSIPFDVNVEIAEAAGSAATFEFMAPADRDVLLWTSEFVEMANAYDFDSGDFVINVWGSLVPSWSDHGSLVARASMDGGTRIDDLATGTMIYHGSSMLRAADFDSTASRVVMSFVEAAPPSFDLVPTSALLIDFDSGAQTELPAMAGGVFSAAFTPDDTQIVAIGGDGAVWILHPESLDTRKGAARGRHRHRDACSTARLHRQRPLDDFGRRWIGPHVASRVGTSVGEALSESVGWAALRRRRW